MVLLFLNLPYFDVFISGLNFFYPSVSHHRGQGRTDGHLCRPHKWRADGNGDMSRGCWQGGVSRRALWARLMACLGDFHVPRWLLWCQLLAE